MFVVSKKKYNELQKRYDELQKRYNELRKYSNSQDKILKKEQVIECETCGCLLFKNRAFKGKSVIVDYDPTNIEPMIFFTPLPKEYIKETYYCKLHKPLDKE